MYTASSSGKPHPPASSPRPFSEMERGLRWAVNCSSWMPSRQEWLSGLALVQSEEADRISKFMFRKDAKLAMAGRLMIRAGLSHLLKTEPTQLHFIRGEKGKPLLIDNKSTVGTKVGFNVSHQGDYCVFAAEIDSEVGVDVMQLTSPRGESVDSFFHTMRRQFTDSEWRQIKDSGQHQLHNFYRFWCLKESFIKAVGSGLSFGLQNLEFKVEPEEDWPPSLGDCCTSTQLYIRGEPADMAHWTFQESLVDDEHCVSVAVGRNLATKATQQTFSQQTISLLLSKLQPAPPPTPQMLTLCDQFMLKKESASIVGR